MGQPAVVFDGVWKRYRRGERHDSLRDLLPAAFAGLWRRRPPLALKPDEFWVLRDVSFELGAGEALGIIGPNGAGKSTALKLLTRILKPTRGFSRVTGRTGALIEVAAGFHPDLTGRENVFLQGAIMGMTRAEIARRFDAIVAFAGIDEFIDTPVKRYSSGMNARLGFAIAAHAGAEVLIVDEVLSVGDAGFQERCVEHMRGLVDRGAALVFVSHNLPAVLDICSRAIVLRRGTVLFDGEPARAVQQYRAATWTRDADGPAAGAVRISRVELLEGEGPSLGVFRTGGRLTIRIHYQARDPIAAARFAVDIHRADGVYCFGSSLTRGRDAAPLRGFGCLDLDVPRLPLLGGCYTVSVGIHPVGGGRPYDLQMSACPFSIVSGHRGLGVAHIEHVWRDPALDGARLTRPAADVEAEPPPSPAAASAGRTQGDSHHDCERRRARPVRADRPA
jgi:lipopolysaccharide transport system ATP-binding protein